MSFHLKQSQACLASQNERKAVIHIHHPLFHTRLMHQQARQVWEALLFLEPCIGGIVARNTRNTTGHTAASGATASNSSGGYGPRFKELEELMRRRVAAQNFGQVGRDVDSKQVRGVEGGGGRGRAEEGEREGGETEGDGEV